ncbi:MAG: SDR family oxidoreductase [Actinomycetota bacterium]|nr:SDR family oxidoreductase [Actinomycetota bacterium]
MGSGRVVVVTGASSGIGRATVARFAREGVSIGLLARGRAGLEAAAEEVEAAGGRALVVPTDVTDPAQVEAAADAVEEAFGPIDVWVNDAMVTVLSELTDMTAEEYRRVTEVTYLGSVHGAMAALRRMRPRDHGVIVQVGSALAFRGIPLQSAYCGAKHGLQGFVESLRAELRHGGSNVHVTTVDLPAVNTPQFNHCRTRLPRHPQPVPPVYQPEVCAEAIVWAAGQRRRRLFVGASTVKTILGNRLAPGLVEWYLARTAYDGQQAEGRPFDPDRPDNLFEPTDQDRDEGAHGIFDDTARTRSPQLLVTENRRGLGLAGAAGAVLGLAARARGRRAGS